MAALKSNRHFLREWTASSRFNDQCHLFILRFLYPTPAPKASSCRAGESPCCSWSGAVHVLAGRQFVHRII